MEDLDYLFRRAEQELEMAASSDVPAAVRAHYLLAGYYLDRCYDPARTGAREASNHARSDRTTSR